MSALFMWPYLIILMIVIVFIIFEKTKINSSSSFYAKNSTLMYGAIVIVLVLFAALRGNGDGDYFRYIINVRYIREFQNVLHIEDFPFEIGYRFLAYIVNLLRLNPQFIIVIMSIISIGNISYAVHKLSPYPILSILIYLPSYLYFDMHHTRSAIAMSFIILAWMHFYNKKKLWSLMCFILAIAFHKTAFIFLLLLPFLLFKMNRIIAYLTLVVFAVVTSFIDPMQLFGELLSIIGFQSLSYKVLSNLRNEYFSYAFSLIDPRLLLALGIYAIPDIVSIKSSKMLEQLRTINYLTVLTMILFSNSTIMTLRLSSFFGIFSLLYLPKVINSIDQTTQTKVLSSFISHDSKLYSAIYNKNIWYIFTATVYALYYAYLATLQVQYIFFFAR